MINTMGWVIWVLVDSYWSNILRVCSSILNQWSTKVSECLVWGQWESYVCDNWIFSNSCRMYYWICSSNYYAQIVSKSYSWKFAWISLRRNLKLYLLSKHYCDSNGSTNNDSYQKQTFLTTIQNSLLWQNNRHSLVFKKFCSSIKEHRFLVSRTLICLHLFSLFLSWGNCR